MSNSQWQYFQSGGTLHAGTVCCTVHTITGWDNLQNIGHSPRQGRIANQKIRKSRIFNKKEEKVSLLIFYMFCSTLKPCSLAGLRTCFACMRKLASFSGSRSARIVWLSCVMFCMPQASKLKQHFSSFSVNSGEGGENSFVDYDNPTSNDTPFESRLLH